MIQLLTKNSRRFCLSASVLAIVAASPALAQNLVLTPGTDYNVYNDLAGKYQTVELASGSNGYLIMDYSSVPTPAGGVGIHANGGLASPASLDPSGSFHNISWDVSTTSAPVFVVDKGATLTMLESGSTFASMFQAAGDVTFQQGDWTFFEANAFLGNVTFQGKSNVDFGVFWWGCCTFASAATFGPNTNLALNDSTITFRQYSSAAPMVIGGNISGSSLADIELITGNLTVNGSDHSKVFTGKVNVGGNETFTVGDSTHSGAVFGGTGAKINLTTVSSVLAGYGTVIGDVTNNGIIKAGGTSGVNGGLTITGSLTLTNTSVVKTAMTPTGVSGLTVNGNLAAAGELDINIASGAYGNGVYPLLVVNGGSISGSFSTVSTAGSVGDVIVGLKQTSTGFTIVTEKGSSQQVYGHLVYANRTALTNFIGSVYDAMAMTPASGGKVDTWITPIGEIENVSRDGLGYDQKTYGVSLGALHRFEEHGGVIGGAFSYRRGNMTIKDDTATTSSNGYDLAIYGGADVNQVRFEGSAFYNLFDAKTNRPMGSFGTSQADQNGFAYGASGQISHEMFGSLLAPYVRGTYARIHLDAASETGSALYDLKHDAINVNTFVTDLGIRVHLLRPQSDRRFKVDADVAWRYDLSDPGETVSGGFANFSGGTSVSYWKGDSKNALRVGVNATGQVTDQIEAYTRIDGILTSHRRAGELAIGVKYKF